MVLGQLGQLSEITYDKRSHKVLLLLVYINIRDIFFKFTVYASFKHTFSFAVVLNFSFLELFGVFCELLLFLSSFLPSYWGT